VFKHWCITSCVVILAALSLSHVCSGAGIDTVIGGSSSSFQPTPWTPNTVSTQYFSVASSDGSNCNIGFFMQGTAAAGTALCANQPAGTDRMNTKTNIKKGTGTNTNYLGPAATLPFYGVSATVNDLNFYINPGSSSYDITLLAAAAGNAGTNQVGIYFAHNAGDPPEKILLNGLTPALGTTTTFIPGAKNFGFFIRTTTDTFYSESARNTTNSSFQHFALFRDPVGATGTSGWQTLFVGVEDSRVGTGLGGDGDYNDAIFKLSCTAGSCGNITNPSLTAPEPGTAFPVLAGLSIAICAGMRRLRRKV
jgi:hypothetical protein